MPQVYSRIDLYDVKIAIKRKGYGFHSSAGVALQLNAASKTRFRKTPPRTALRDPLRPIFKSELDNILKLSESVEEAVMHIERLSLGEDLAPQETLEREGAAAGLSADEIAHLIDNRVGMQVHKEMQPIHSKLEDMMGELKLLLQGVPIEALPEEPEDPEEEPPETNDVAATPRSRRKKSEKKQGKKKKKKSKKGSKRPPRRTPDETENILGDMGLGGEAPEEIIEELSVGPND